MIATVKHLVGNETEFERYTSSSVIDERTLRELYLLPFEHAVRVAGVLALMTSYNRVNGAPRARPAPLPHAASSARSGASRAA